MTAGAATWRAPPLSWEARQEEEEIKVPIEPEWNLIEESNEHLSRNYSAKSRFTEFNCLSSRTMGERSQCRSKRIRDDINELNRKIFSGFHGFNFQVGFDGGQHGQHLASKQKPLSGKNGIGARPPDDVYTLS